MILEPKTQQMNRNSRAIHVGVQVQNIKKRAGAASRFACSMLDTVTGHRDQHICHNNPCKAGTRIACVCVHTIAPLPGTGVSATDIRFEGSRPSQVHEMTQAGWLGWRP